MTSLHRYLSAREYWERAEEEAREELEQELGREPTIDELVARTEELLDDPGDDCDRAYDNWRDAQMLEGLERYDRERADE
jgi:DNA-directed RNA polymerase specialized sigma subunit